MLSKQYILNQLIGQRVHIAQQGGGATLSVAVTNSREAATLSAAGEDVFEVTRQDGGKMYYSLGHVITINPSPA